jgi:predicted Zn-ribbon and HTH transcriptional regulator
VRLIVQDLDKVLQSSGDITIGAYARQLQRRRILLGGLGVLLLAGAVVIVMMASEWGSSDAPSPQVTLHCRQCGHEFTSDDDPTRPYPTTCPECESQSAWPVWQCRDCAHRFVPAISGVPFKCPECGSTSVGNPLDSSSAPQ